MFIQMSSNRKKQSEEGEARLHGGAAAGGGGGDGHDGEEVETDEAAQSEHDGAPLRRWERSVQEVFVCVVYILTKRSRTAKI